MTREWKPSSWRGLPIRQQPHYSDEVALNAVLNKIHEYPPLVSPKEIEVLKSQLKKASDGRAFILQGGDCAERFQDCNRTAIKAKLKVLLQMSAILSYGLKVPVIKIGRFAGQYAKPRSADCEVVDGNKIPVFRGDIIHSFEATVEGRRPDPDRLIEAYQFASMTLNYVRTLLADGFNDLHHHENWAIEYASDSPQKKKYEALVDKIQNAVGFIEAVGAKNDSHSQVDGFFTSHEGLLLGFEESLTHLDKETGLYYNRGAHMLWIGDRTKDIDGAHVEYMRGIANPIGIKVGPTTEVEELLSVIRKLNPTKEEGKIILISRFGHDKVVEYLPSILERVKKSGEPVIWNVDPMHGNAVKTSNNYKTRDFSHILSEVLETFSIFRRQNVYLAGVHFELTGNDVTECIGGAQGLTIDDLTQSYETYCDPRLNYSQSLEVAFLISSMVHS